MTTIESYEAGDLTAQQALRALLSDLREVESSIAPLEQERANLRDAIGLIAARATGPLVVEGLGKVSITAPSRTTGYDSKAIATLMMELIPTHPEIAARIVATQKVSERAGSLRIEKA